MGHPINGVTAAAATAAASDAGAARWATPLALADEAMAAMRAQGFDASQVDASQRAMTELNIAHDQASLLRSTERRTLQLVGLVDGRRAATELAPRDRRHLIEAIATLHAEALAAPQDSAHAVSAGQRQAIEQGPVDLGEGPCVDSLAAAVEGLLGFRAAQAPTVSLLEGAAAHVQLQCHTLTSEGSELAARMGWYELACLANAREQGRTSSFNELNGATRCLDETTAAQFGIEAMLLDLARQTAPQRLAERYTGDVVLAPAAVASLLGWLLAQVGDAQLIGGSSVLRDRVGEQIASAALNLRSRFDAPGVLGYSADACRALPVQLLQSGRLQTLLPGLYASRKTGLPHRPTAAAGWVLDAGDTPLQAMLGTVRRGALVARLSMGAPAANGDFSGIIKNSFAVEGGQVGPALAETMVTGNVGRMLRDVAAVSRERIDNGAWCLPWLQVSGLQFS